MTTHIEHQIIEQNGKPAFAVIPYAIFKKLLLSQAPVDHTNEIQNGIPLRVLEIEITEGKSLPRAWREYLKISQAELAKKMNITQSALSQIEKPGAKLRKQTISTLAQALGIHPSQLDC
jgi:DNA-binding XRE family transcriptional regulator